MKWPMLLDDTCSMIDFERDEWSRTPGLKQLLETYRRQYDVAKRQNPEFDGWLPRIGTLDGVEPAEIARLHGKLIALGYLRFQLHDRRTGVQYQVDLASTATLDGPAHGMERNAA
jgi:hypothetical protein